MSDLFVLSESQMARISPHFPLARGVPRVDEQRVASGIIVPRTDDGEVAFADRLRWT